MSGLLYDDISIIVRLVGESQENDLEEAHKRERQRLSSRLEDLNMFIELSSLLRDELTENLENISHTDSSTDT